MSTTGTASPCVKVCTVDEHDVCRGCLRTLDEIAAWPRLDDDQRRAVLARVSDRRRPPPPP